MGSNQSIRATHFQRPGHSSTKDDMSESDDPPDEHHISISNKMVERLVEDATLAGGAAAAVAAASGVGTKTPRTDHKEKILLEKLKTLDDHHSERFGLTIEDANALAKRVELRTAAIASPQPVCAECEQKVIECFTAVGNDSLLETMQCWDTVGAFSKCVQEAAGERLRARTQKEAREHARRSRHVTLAREHALKDLGPPPTATPS